MLSSLITIMTLFISSEKIINGYCPPKASMLQYLLNNRVAGCVGLYLLKMEVMPMKNQFDFMDLMTFGLFLLALLTFIFMFCK